MKTVSVKRLVLLNRSLSIGVFLVICLLFNPDLLFGQDIENLHIEKVPEEGLLDEHIASISQDANGFIWFGTREGVFRYDGYNYKAFRNVPGDSTTLINNEIDILFSERNNLWIGTRKGLSCININNLTCKNYYEKEFLQVNSIISKNDSVLWVGTSTGLYIFNEKHPAWKKLSISKKNIFVSALNDDKKGHLYITTHDGFGCYTIATGVLEHFKPDLPQYPQGEKGNPIPYIKSVIDKDGNVWLSTWGAGLVQYNPQNKKIRSWCAADDDSKTLPYRITVDLLTDKSGHIWIANKEGGLTIFNPDKNTFTKYPVDWRNENNLSGSVVSLFRDKSGIVWIGTENGVFKYDPHRIHLSKTFFLLKTDLGLLQTPISPTAMLKDKDGIWWMGMYEGLFIFDEKTGVLQDFNKSFGLSESSPMAVFNILQDKSGSIWLTARNCLVKISKITHNKVTSLKSEIFKSDSISNTLTSLYIDDERRIWVGNSNGIFRFDPVLKKFISYHFNAVNSHGRIKEIRTFCELSKDSLLVGGENTGLILLHVNSDRYENIPWDRMPNRYHIDPSINVIYKKDGVFWIGADAEGLFEVNRQLKIVSTETISDGLPSMNISAILGDKQNNLWLLTDAGAVAFQIRDRKITLFDKNDGIINLDELNTIIADSIGNISIGGRGCNYSFNPANIIKNTYPPDVDITDLRVFDKDYAINNGETVKLNYNQNYFSVAYVALNYTQSRFNKYAYKMVGLDKKWNYAGPRRYVSYANLDEGTYVFNVKACNNEGVWNMVPARFVLIISPPIWHRWWFYLSFSALILSLVYFLYVYNLNQLKIRLQLRDKIARDLHDDIGSTLSGINIFSKIALQKLNSDRNSSRDLLEKISERSEKTLDALSDIVWSINTRNDGLDNLLMKAREYLSEVLEAQGVLYELNADPELEHLKIGMATRKELYLIFKETIYNASKYADCSFVKVCFTKHKDTCKLTIFDNGKGFNLNCVSSGNGIHNMKHRAKKIDAVFYIESAENKGTLVSLTFRIPRNR